MYIIVIDEIVILFAYPKLLSPLVVAENWSLAEGRALFKNNLLFPGDISDKCV